MTSAESFYVSSSLVKEVAAVGGDIAGVAPPAVVAALENKRRQAKQTLKNSSGTP
jgi:phosphopantetheine adenylyltransferase